MGENIVQGQNTEDTIVMQLNPDEDQLEVKKNTLCRRDGDKVLAKFTFDEFIYVDFLRAIDEVVLFVTNPTPKQFRALTRFQVSKEANNRKKIEEACALEESNDTQILMLEEFLKDNLQLLRFASEIHRLVTVEK